MISGLTTDGYKALGVGIAVLLALAAIYFGIHAYGDSRYDAGVAETDAAYKLASEKLLKEAANARGEANKAAAAREADGAARLIEEKEKIDAAVAAGRSPYDDLFPSTNRVQ